MAYEELLEEFEGRRVVDYENSGSWSGPEVAYRLREEFEDEVSVADRLDSLIEQPGADQLSALVIGAWSDCWEGGGSQAIVEKLVASAHRLPALRSLFLGDMTFEECEISWIIQSDMSPLLRAFPDLETFGVRGGEELAFSRLEHDGLRTLVIQTGGLSRSTLRDLFLCEFPLLERLELLLGEPQYGFDGSVEDLQPLLSGRLYPDLKYLGLMNSEIANDIAAVVVNSPIVERIEVLDLSLGTLDEEGVRSLMGLASQTNLKRLDISHHYAPQQAVDALQEALPFEVIAEDRQELEADEDDEIWRFVLHAE